MEHEELVKELVRTIKRLSINNILCQIRVTQYNELIRMIEKKKTDTLTRKNKQALSEIIEHSFYKGKLTAYILALQRLVGLEKANELLLEDVLGEKNIDRYGAKIKNK